MTKDHIVAVGLLTSQEVQRLGSAFQKLWPVSESPAFDGLLQAIDEADREVRNARPMPMPPARL